MSGGTLPGWKWRLCGRCGRAWWITRSRQGRRSAFVCPTCEAVAARRTLEQLDLFREERA